MNAGSLIIEVENLTRRYGKADAVDGLSFRVRPGTCYGFFGRNGAGKTTTIKCLLNLLRPTAGAVRVFGMDPASHELEVKVRVAYVPEAPGFYPWMTVRGTLDYLASFRARWDERTERELLGQFRLDAGKKVSSLSKGQKAQLALVAAIAPGPELLILDEPTSGLDPVVRRELAETIIGVYQDADPGRRTVFLSTHLISEVEGLIDDFTIIEGGRAVLSLGADEARGRFRRIRARFPHDPPGLALPANLEAHRHGRDLELVVNGNSEEILDRIRAHAPDAISAEGLTLEEIFLASVSKGGGLP
jgi:ABC-2 type transport system ATP-binding protein